MRAIQLAIKSVLDVLVSFLLLVLLSPLLVILAVLVRLDSPGPVIFRQRRLGRGGREFEIYKFRSMVDNAPEVLNRDGSTFSGENDPRTTKLGRFLRRSSLDELPQLVNVLCGQMSLIGPRPDKADQISLYEEHEHRKLALKPGMTGYAMIHGRNEIPWKERIARDVYYVNHYSLGLDLLVVVKTIPLVISRRGTEAPRTAAKPPVGVNQ